MGSSYTIANDLLDKVFNGVDFTPAGTLYLALYTDTVARNGAGTEVTGGSYARKSISFGTVVNGQVSNNADVTFTDMPAVTVTSWGIWDTSATQGGTAYWVGTFNTPIDVSLAATFQVNSGRLTAGMY